MVNSKSITLRTIDASTPDLHSSLESVLAIQKLLIVDRDVKDTSNGFLISQFELTELSHIIANGGYLILAQADNDILGYVLITPINEFTDLLREDGTSFETDQPLDFKKCLYLYQIAVAPSSRGLGIGRLLISAAKKTTSHALLADILIQPMNNQHSVEFFHNNSFVTIGRLNLKSYRTFGALQSLVVLWR